MTHATLSGPGLTDPWKATETLRRSEWFRAPLRRVMGELITREIESDPAEVARLRSARKQVREGRIIPRRSRA